MATNAVMNLTAIRSVEDAVEKHLLDSLTLLPVLAAAGDDVAAWLAGAFGEKPAADPLNGCPNAP
jgi:hypothetical protein